MVTACRLGCGASMWLKMRAEHEESLCSERLVACKWECGDDIKVNAVEGAAAREGGVISYILGCYGTAFREMVIVIMIVMDDDKHVF